MLDIERVTVVLGGATVLSGVSARVERGGWLGVIGPNGAGKSTLVRAVTGLLPYEGDIRIAGEAYAKSDQRRRARSVAYVPQRPVLPRSMSVTDYVLLGPLGAPSLPGSRDSPGPACRRNGARTAPAQRVCQTAARRAFRGRVPAGRARPCPRAGSAGARHGRAHHLAGPRPQPARARAR